MFSFPFFFARPTLLLWPRPSADDTPNVLFVPHCDGLCSQLSSTGDTRQLGPSRQANEYFMARGSRAGSLVVPGRFSERVLFKR